MHCLAWISRLYLTSGPVVWNSFPEYLRDPTLSIDSCRHYFKTYFLLVINIQRLSALETAWLHALYHRSYCDYDCVTVSCVLLPVYDWWLLWLWLCDSQLRVITGIWFVIIVIVIVWQSVACYYITGMWLVIIVPLCLSQSHMALKWFLNYTDLAQSDSHIMCKYLNIMLKIIRQFTWVDWLQITMYVVRASVRWYRYRQVLILWRWIFVYVCTLQLISMLNWHVANIVIMKNR